MAIQICSYFDELKICTVKCISNKLIHSLQGKHALFFSSVFIYYDVSDIAVGQFHKK